MSDEDLPAPQVEFISARDAELPEIISDDFRSRFEVQSYRNAARILESASPDEFRELLEALSSFSISTEDMVKGGGNKSQIAKGRLAVRRPKPPLQPEVSPPA